MMSIAKVQLQAEIINMMTDCSFIINRIEKKNTRNNAQSRILKKGIKIIIIKILEIVYVAIKLKTSNKTTKNCIFRFSNLESGTISRNVKGTNKTKFPKIF